MSFWITLHLVISPNITISLMLVLRYPRLSVEFAKKLLRRRCDRYSSEEKLNDVVN